MVDNLQIIKETFLSSLKSKKAFGEYLSIDLSKLNFILYSRKINLYNEFAIKKRNGDNRTIYSPIKPLKDIQKKIANCLLDTYKAKSCVHGFCKDKSIKTNASLHVNKKLIIHIDIKNFFEQINFGRVRGLFLSQPFVASEEVATLLAKICTYNNMTPQGSPSSPIISNFICYKLDNEFLKLAKEYRLSYTRYADDIILSSAQNRLPEILSDLKEKSDGLFEIPVALSNIVNRNGFSINEKKFKIVRHSSRQRVTGLIVNKRINLSKEFIKTIRVMLHKYEKNGLESASNEYFLEVDKRNRPNFKKAVSYDLILAGKINYIKYIKGIDDLTYLKFADRYKKLNPKFNFAVPKFSNRAELRNDLINLSVLVEGKTDHIHLGTALEYFQKKGKFLNLKLQIISRYTGESQLISALKLALNLPLNDIPSIYLFDNDVEETTQTYGDEIEGFRSFKNNIFSQCLPKPQFLDKDCFCIEMMYPFEIIKSLRDQYHRRLYLREEFNLEEDGRHINEQDVFLRKNKQTLVSERVENSEGKSIGLSKNKFAELIKENTDKVNFEAFEQLFTNFCRIYDKSKLLRV